MSASLSQGIQEGLVALLLFDPKGAPVASGMVPIAAYDPFFRQIATEAIEFLEKHKVPAGDHALELIGGLKVRYKKDAPIYDRIWESLLVTKDNVNRDFVFARAGKFAKGQHIRDGVEAAITALERDDETGVDEAEQALKKALEGSYDMFDPGGRFDDPERALSFLTQPREAFPTGIEAFDRAGIAPSRGELFIMAADTGVGKSWFLLHLAKHALMARKRVLYVTLEMTEKEAFQRLAMSFFSYTARAQLEGVAIQRLKSDDEGRFASMRSRILTDRPHLFDHVGPAPGVEERLRRELRGMSRRPHLYVKEYPAASLTMRKFRSDLSLYESSEGFLPDLICFDYPDEMEIASAEHKRTELITIFTQLKGIAQERNLAMATVTQLNAEGAKARVATKSHLAEARGKAHKADVLITASQTPEEHALGLCRLFAAKGRHGKDRFGVLVSQSLDLGQFVVDSSRLSDSYEALLHDATEGAS